MITRDVKIHAMVQCASLIFEKSTNNTRLNLSGKGGLQFFLDYVLLDLASDDMIEKFLGSLIVAANKAGVIPNLDKKL